MTVIATGFGPGAHRPPAGDDRGAGTGFQAGERALRRPEGRPGSAVVPTRLAGGIRPTAVTGNDALGRSLVDLEILDLVRGSSGSRCSASSIALIFPRRPTTNAAVASGGVQTPHRTPLYERHRALGARLVPFAGWEMPVQYEGVIQEHRAVRGECGVFDVSHMESSRSRGPRLGPSCSRALERHRQARAGRGPVHPADERTRRDRGRPDRLSPRAGPLPPHRQRVEP